MSQVVILCGCFVGKFYSFKLGLLGGVCFLHQESSWILRVWLTSEELGEWLKVLWLSADPQSLLQTLLNQLHLVHRQALGAAEDLAMVRASVYLRIPGFGVLHLELCYAIIWRCFLSLWARCWNSPCPFSSGRKRETFMAQWKQKWALALALRLLSPRVLWVSSSLILWLRLQGTFGGGYGSPLAPLPSVCFEAQINWEGRAGALCSFFSCSSYSHPECGWGL